jgi:2-oxoglutarate ferredoxin oxidoreductase subunit gamma
MRFVKTIQKTDARQVELDIYRTVIHEIGKPIVFNICMLGAFIELTGLVRMESIVKTIESKIPRDFLPMNRKALELGAELARNR